MCASSDWVEEKDFSSLLLSGVPLIDLRSEIEFSEGAFPASVNLPILNTTERAQVGLCYKEQGSAAARELGFRLVSGDLKKQRIQSWREVAGKHPGAVLYCWRGGLRSEIAQQWLADAGVSLPRVRGGYKALRRFLLTRASELSTKKWLIISGYTGVGKTKRIHELIAGGEPAIDLEAAANHRGSAFGARGSQPPQASFENYIYQHMLLHAEADQYIVEDESRRIGACVLPDFIFSRMRGSPRVVIEATEEERIANIIGEYIVPEIDNQNFEQSLRVCEERYMQQLLKIGKKLGGERCMRILEVMRSSFDEHRRSRQSSAHAAWIKQLLVHYYDPLYEISTKRREAELPS